MKGLTRREFLLLSGAALAAGCSPATRVPPPGDLLGPDAGVGHRLRDGGFGAPVRTEKVPVLVAGAGIAGLSCAWWLQRQGFSDFRLLELDSSPGGNARAAHNTVSAYPLGAHYLPLPGVEADYVRLMLADFGVLRGDPRAEAPAYDERLLVQAPDERLYIHGRWQDELLPRFGVGAGAQREIRHFEALMQEWTRRRGRDGRPAFAVPSPLSSVDPDIRAMDRVSFHDWLWQQGLRGEPLHWYVDYCCRDDYGASPRQVSAWAGLHYFCSRRGMAANAEHDSVLTAPQGNGWIVEQLVARLRPQLAMRQAVVRLAPQGAGLAADVFDAARGEVVRLLCEHVVWAAPLFLLPRVWPGDGARPLPEYAPWVVVNLTLQGVEEAEYTTWDNVIYKGRGLGYVDATHQSLQYRRPDRVLTWYHALSGVAPREARRQLAQAPREQWAQQAFADLQRPHPGLAQHCTRADVWRWPHAMAIPAPGFLAQLPARRRSPHPRLQLAHSDLSGFSIFEEAQYWGVEAARTLLREIG